MAQQQGYGAMPHVVAAPYQQQPGEAPPNYGAGQQIQRPSGSERAALLASGTSTAPGNGMDLFGNTDEDDATFREYVRVEFEDVVREVPGATIVDAVKNVHRLTYTWTKNITYHFLTLLLGFFLSFWWGMIFAFYAHGISWWYYPFYRLLKMTIYVWALPFRAMCRAFVNPLYEAISMMFSNIRVSFRQKTIPLEIAPAIESA